VDTDQDSRPGLTIAEAAEALGISVDAVRKRIRRGLVRCYKLDGRWYVVLDGSTGQATATANGAGPHGQDSGPGPVQDVSTLEARVTDLLDQVAFLRQELEHRTEEIRRRDHIIAALTPQRPALPEPAGERPWWAFWRSP
jgi:excisionase family DNA binding protein